MPARTITTDAAAALVLLHGTKADMTRLRREVQIASGDLCPECGCTDCEDNGCRGADLEYRCTTCDHRWEASECTVTVPAPKRTA